MTSSVLSQTCCGVRVAKFSTGVAPECQGALGTVCPPLIFTGQGVRIHGLPARLTTHLEARAPGCSAVVGLVLCPWWNHEEGNRAGVHGRVYAQDSKIRRHSAWKAHA